jgi:class 3 adenylate cyclase
MSLDLESMSLTEMIRLREQISEVLLRRFERNLALAFTDVVGSTAYFAEFGDEAGRGLMQRHYDALGQVLPRHEGRVVDTAGDGAFTCFPTSDQALAALSDVQHLILEQNANRPPQHHLTIRAGVHWGPVLTDGVVVTGDAVNTCARVTSTSAPSEIRLTKAAFLVLSSVHRSRCTVLAPTELKGIPRPVEMMLYKWHTQAEMPAWVTVRETGEKNRLPQKPVISFGRLRDHNGMQANDIVLMPANPDEQVKLSRWHFELRQQLDGMHITALSDQITEVDGRAVARGQSAPIRVGTEVRLAGGVMTLVFEGDGKPEAAPAGAQRTVMLGAIKIDGLPDA